MDQIRDFIAGFVVQGLAKMSKPNFNFIRKSADYYDSGLVTKDFILKDILRYDRNWPVRRYWLNGDIRILNGLEAHSIEVQYQIKDFVKNPRKESSGSAVKTLKLRKARNGLEITSVRETTSN